MPDPRAAASPGHRLLPLLAGVWVTTLSACHRAAPAAPPVPEVGVAVLEPQAVELTDDFNGRVEAVDAVELRPRVSGYLTRITSQEGDAVEAGTVLFVIDPRPYHIALARAQAQAQRAQATANLAQLQQARVKKLFAARATSQEELDNAEAGAGQAQADLHAAGAAVDDAALNLSFTEVRSPIAGRVGRASLTVGNVARADESVLTTVVSQDPVYVYFDCDEQSYLRFSAERAGRRPIADDGVQVELADGRGFSRTGTVDFLDNRLDPATGTIRARVRLANPEHVLTPGLYARVRLAGSHAERALLVDDKAVLTDQDRQYVYVVGPGNHALRRDVTVGRAVGSLKIIEHGLASGDRVVIRGLQKILYPGAVVAPVPMGESRVAASPVGTR
jgi:multidrug efflux system membrane fusion protein